MTAHLPPLPACCTPLDARWPWPRPLPGAQLIRTCFKPTQLDPGDFARQGIAAPRGVAKRQSEFLAGRLCARAALLQLTGTASVPAVGDDGAPRWPQGVVGSITHGAGWAAAVVAPVETCLGLGLDLEVVLSPARAERLAGQILIPDELARLHGLTAEQRAFQVSLTFSLKEALFKALYPLVQTRFYFEHAELLESSPEGHARLRLLKDLHADWRSGRELSGQFCMLEGRVLSLVSAHE